jgi:hypothetical protein
LIENGGNSNEGRPALMLPVGIRLIFNVISKWWQRIHANNTNE